MHDLKILIPIKRTFSNYKPWILRQLNGCQSVKPAATCWKCIGHHIAECIRKNQLIQHSVAILSIVIETAKPVPCVIIFWIRKILTDSNYLLRHTILIHIWRNLQFHNSLGYCADNSFSICSIFMGIPDLPLTVCPGKFFLVPLFAVELEKLSWAFCMHAKRHTQAHDNAQKQHFHTLWNLFFHAFIPPYFFGNYNCSKIHLALNRYQQIFKSWKIALFFS